MKGVTASPLPMEGVTASPLPMEGVTASPLPMEGVTASPLPMEGLKDHGPRKAQLLSRRRGEYVHRTEEILKRCLAAGMYIFV
jgi:hypothetical protein